MTKRETNTDTETNTLKVVEFFPDSAVKKELAKLPKVKRNQFLLDLGMLSKGLAPVSKVKNLTGLGNGVIELIINGSPAFRCIYYTKLEGRIVVLHATEKTAEGRDSQIANVVTERLKMLEQQEKRDKRRK